MAAYKRNQPVRMLSLTGHTFDHDWSQTARIVRHERGFNDGQWYAVKFDDGGGKLLVHASRLMPSNAPRHEAPQISAAV
ncbi:hypothetical protein UFOVP1020_4 [uncultured Caudovirales phage]|uniref:Uncharacterized protein n=1 Tax=uncultured Caudovirales phage TaxID=2100421 RepID=A0A6J5QAV0_9CAUD|nr:hypothetical protein UFOVP512_9 [uncultured Caudovirales phage]CAB4178661.1 hypothetical protein UFOVP1020_4 [uncultured Caudovirales phage]CAB4188105.1 hypothetical protein UFOVP1170_53 [uncultured Caudovirales phage]CAB4220557.1 hypothetical protein UFOVP1621_46 [uncultured Caudovirales phage]